MNFILNFRLPRANQSTVMKYVNTEHSIPRDKQTQYKCGLKENQINRLSFARRTRIVNMLVVAWLVICTTPTTRGSANHIGTPNTLQQHDHKQ